VADLVPVIDISAWAGGTPDERAALVAAVDDACRRIGFLQIAGHGIPDDVLEGMQAATSAFFSLPEAVKRESCSPSPEINRGYAAKGSEGLAYSVGVQRPPDLFEAFNIGPDDPDLTDPAVLAERHRWFVPNIWPDATPELQPALNAYFDEARRVADTLLDIFAVALGMPPGWFAPFATHSTDTMRVNHYATAPGDPDPLEGQVGMGEHTDYGIVTVLYADPVPGLQIVGPDGAWHDVTPSPGCLLVNLGDLTATWTNDRWRSTIHRVLPPARLPDRANLRRSVAFFHDGNWDASIECLPTCTDETDPPRYAPTTAGEHLLGKLLGPRTLTVSDATDTTGSRLPA
jgi:isopenicillin N synthase-like dioxygenase